MAGGDLEEERHGAAGGRGEGGAGQVAGEADVVAAQGGAPGR
ncbi:TlyA family rRNA (cytidine-2'-O)-methyltransferase, partial [Streptosporangium nondiastaticum]